MAKTITVPNYLKIFDSSAVITGWPTRFGVIGPGDAVVIDIV
jgi:hypothetical protein